jgi:hypothetical protein
MSSGELTNRGPGFCHFQRRLWLELKDMGMFLVAGEKMEDLQKL